MMSHSHGKALVDKQNILHVFRKHFKSTEKSCSPFIRCTSKCMCSSCHNQSTDSQHGQKHKVKRLKTRKERNHTTQGCEGRGLKIKTQHHRLHHNVKVKDHCHGCCQSFTCPSQRKDAPFARVLHSTQEPSIITDHRLTGHHGLFNHEVKSIDIERLLSEQRKLDKFGHHGEQKKNCSTILPPTLSSTNLPSSLGLNCNTEEVGDCNTEEVGDCNTSDKRKPERATTCLKVQSNVKCKSNFIDSNGTSRDTLEVDERKNTSIAVCLEERENSPSHGSGIPPEQRHQGSLTISDSNFVLLSSADSPLHIMEAVRKEHGPGIPLTGEALLPDGGQKKDLRLKDTQVNTLNRKLTLQNNGCSQPQSPSPKHTEASSLDIGASESSGPQQIDQTCGPHPISKVAARLCTSLELPLLSRRHLMVESRDVLLQVLRERHGPHLQENLLRVQQHLSFSTRHTQAHHKLNSRPQGVDQVDGAWPAALFEAGSRENSMEQSCLNPVRTTGLKRRRKQLCPLRVPLYSSKVELPQGQDMSVPWTTNPSVEQVGDLFGELLRPPSTSHFLMDIQNSGASPPNHMFGSSPDIHWGGRACPPSPWDEGLTRGLRASSRMGGFDNWRHDPDLSFLNQTDAIKERNIDPQWHEMSRQSLVHYPTRPPEGNPRHRSLQQDPFEFERKHSSASSTSVSALQQPQHSLELHPFYRFHRPPPSPTPISHFPDMACYPPSYMLERGFSPHRSFLPAFPSPEKWSFPRMRLY